MLSFGDAAPLIPRIKAHDALVICQVHSLAQARGVLAEGADIIVAQGTEAGGHGGRRATLASHSGGRRYDRRFRPQWGAGRSRGTR
jgi:NAD(P)H-dependent flavin oxidoreductase YrpB (nitropropane dioxygenase family)